MNAAGLAEFNAQKATLVRAMFPASVVFTQRPGTSYPCAFGEVADDGQLHPSGSGVQHHRTGALYWPVTSGHSPDLMHTFRITVCAQSPSLVGTTWKIDEVKTAAHEPTQKFRCHKVEEA